MHLRHPVSPTSPRHEDTQTQRHRHTETQAHRHIDTRRHRHTFSPPCISHLPETRRYAYTDTETQRHRDTQTQRHRHRREIARACAQTHTRTSSARDKGHSLSLPFHHATHERAYTQTQTQTFIHTRTHVHVHAHTYTHTPPRKDKEHASLTYRITLHPPLQIGRAHV